MFWKQGRGKWTFRTVSGRRPFPSFVRSSGCGGRGILGQDGLAALADGLDQFLEDAVKTLKKEAEHTGSALDDSFVSLYFPVEIPGQTQECREESSGSGSFPASGKPPGQPAKKKIMFIGGDHVQ